MASTHFARRDTAPHGAKLNPGFARATWRHVYRHARLIRDAFGAPDKPRTPMQAALLGLHNQLPRRLCEASAHAAIVSGSCAPRRGDVLGFMRPRKGSTARISLFCSPRLPA